MNPTLAAARLGFSCLLGSIGGLWFGFLRPLRPRWLWDLLFIAGLLWLWLILGFAICDGDLRMGYTAAFLGCAFLCDRTVGRLTAPLFSVFWKVIRRILGFFLYPFREILKKIHKIAKKYLQWEKNGVQ